MSLAEQLQLRRASENVGKVCLQHPRAYAFGRVIEVKGEDASQNTIVDFIRTYDYSGNPLYTEYAHKTAGKGAQQSRGVRRGTREGWKGIRHPRTRERRLAAGDPQGSASDQGRTAKGAKDTKEDGLPGKVAPQGRGACRERRV